MMGLLGTHPALYRTRGGSAFRTPAWLACPFHNYDANQAWVELVAVAALLLAVIQGLVDDDELAVAEPRRLRYTLLHIAARGWPTTLDESGSSSTAPGPGPPNCWGSTTG